MQKVYRLYVERSSSLYRAEETLAWAKEVAAYLLGRIDAGTIDPAEEATWLFSLSQLPFEIDRYKGLRVADFSDDVSTINPNELFGGN